MRDVVEQPLIGIPTSESIAREMRSGNVDLSAIGLTTGEVARTHDLARSVRHHIEAALSGKSPAVMARCLEQVRDPEITISLEFLAILAHAGAHAAAWLVIQDKLDHVRVPGGTGANIMSPGSDRNHIDPHVHFGSSRYRMPAGVISLPPQTLPATIAAAAIGRPLRSILSHPALDGFDHVVTWTAEQDDQIEVGYGPHHPAITLSDLEPRLMWPDGHAVRHIHDLARQLRETRTEDMIDRMTDTPA